MDRFKDFFKENYAIVEEGIDARIDELAESGVFSHFGREAIERRFDWYKKNGIVPTQRFNKAASELAMTRRNEGRSDDEDITKTIDVTDKEFEEMLVYVFKFLDKEVRDTLEAAYKDNERKENKLKKHYEGLTLRDVVEDSSQINAVLANWLVVRHNKKYKVPKSLRQKINFTDLQKKVDNAVAEITGASVSGDARSGVDADMPEGFSFIKQVGEHRLYKWSALGDVCSLDPKVKQNWLSIVITLAGATDEKWCVASESFARNYGEPKGDGTFQYPYYLVRKKDGDSFKPYVLMHGNSLQCKDRGDDAIDEATAEEILPLVKDHLETIIFG